MAAFRECYAHLHELRSLASNTIMVALTATATKLTKETILSVLLMENPDEIKESPNKLNVTYVVECMKKDSDHEMYFGWLVDELRSKQASSPRTIIYCQTIKQCGIIYATIKGMLGNDMHLGNATDPTNVLVEMLHSCTPAANKDRILNSFQSVDGSIRLLIATIAFGMGVDCKGVHRVVHYGPSKNVESYVQETGRAGRDGHQSVAYILYYGILLNHIDGHMKSYVKTSECRRKELLKHFDSVAVQPETAHLCCDNCATECECGSQDCGEFAAYPLYQREATISHTVREVPPDKKKIVEENLIKYHKSLVLKLVNTTAHGDVKTLTNLQFMLGFSEHQITQVVDNLGMIFSLSDVYEFVEIWDRRHALHILSVVSDVFQDVNDDNQSHTCTVSPEDNDYVFDDELMDEWNEVLQDDDLFDMIVNNLSLSQLDNSLLEEEHVSDDSVEDEVPTALLGTVEAMNLIDS